MLKKQEEVLGKKNLPKHKLENFIPAKVSDKHKNDTNEHMHFKDKLKAVDTDELEALKKSKYVGYDVTFKNKNDKMLALSIHTLFQVHWFP